MAFDTPARIAIIGAGPIGLEAALYGRFLGYAVDIFEQETVCNHVRQWGHLEMITPFRLNSSPLGIRALHAQDESFAAPDPEEIQTGQQWIENYLQPLAESDLISDGLHEHCEVVCISRLKNRNYDQKQDEEDQFVQDENGFRILLERGGVEEAHEADIVIDASGNLGQANWLGPNGAPAIGEQAFRQANESMLVADRVLHFVTPDLKQHVNKYSGKSILVLGSDLAAANTICDLAKIAELDSGTDVTWIVEEVSENGPINEIEDDEFVHGAAQCQQANQIFNNANNLAWINAEIDQTILAASYDVSKKKCVVEFPDLEAAKNWKSKPKQIFREFDQVIAHVGFRPNLEIFRELTLSLDNAMECPDSLLTTEPNFYILGVKSLGRDTGFLFTTGLKQIKELFSIIGDRDSLDLYQGVGQE